MTVATALQCPETTGPPNRVPMVGAGATGRAIALQLGTLALGILLVAIPDRKPTKRRVTISLLIYSLSLTLLPGAKAMAETYTTNFPLVENPISEAGRWINGQVQGTLWRNCRTLTGPNRVVGTQGGSDSPPYNDTVCLVTGTWGGNQTVQATIYRVNPNSNQFQEVELRLRTTITLGNATGYEINIGLGAGAPYTQIVRWNGGLVQRSCADGPPPCFSLIDGNATSWANGDIVRATVTGTSPVVISVFKSTDGGQTFNQVISTTDSGDANGGPWLSGAPGVGMYRQNQSDPSDHNADYGFTCFSATDSGVPPPCSASSAPAAPAGLLVQ